MLEIGMRQTGYATGPGYVHPQTCLALLAPDVDKLPGGEP